MGRLFAAPKAIEVSQDSDARPLVVTWKGRKEKVKVCNYWRAGGEWWKENSPREYYKVLTTSKAILVIYRQDEAWFVERVLD